jgi:hypothetical protein
LPPPEREDVIINEKLLALQDGTGGRGDRILKLRNLIVCPVPILPPPKKRGIR